MIYIKSSYDIENIKKTCKIWIWVKKKLYDFIKEGKSLIEIDSYAKDLIESKNAFCTFKNYNGFEGNICLSVNEVIIHGVPTKYTLKKNDILTLDIGITYNGYICDAAFTIIIGNNEEAIKLSEVCYESLLKGIEQVKPGNKIGDISFAIQNHVEKNGYFILENFGGHGCGIKLHEDPIILNYGKKNTGPILKEGMIICIEPMIMIESNEYFIDQKDKWSVKSKNNKMTCHWEHMVLVTSDGYEILTLE